MTQKIILSADETVCCPKCAASFPLSEGITRQTIEHYEEELEAVLKAREDELREAATKDAERKLGRAHTSQLDALKEELAERDRKLVDSKAKQEALVAQARTQVAEELAAEQKLLKDELEAKNASLKEFREQELKLRQEKRELEEARQQMELQLQRKLEAARGELEQSIRATESEHFKLREAELRKKIEDAQKVNADLQRKLEQGSGQLQGEVLELEIEELLERAFPIDQIEPVAKGKRGADVIQRVMAPTGQMCGTVVWETKRAANWSEPWVTKLKDDQQEARADVAVLVTTAMPKDVDEPFLLYNDIWLVRPDAVRPLAETLRVMLVELQKTRASNEGRQEKMAMLYDYLSSPQFAQKIRMVVDAFATMKKDLDAEKAALQRQWKKRETQIERVTMSMVGMCGELQAIAQNALPQLDDIARLPGMEDDEALAEI